MEFQREIQIESSNQEKLDSIVYNNFKKVNLKLVLGPILFLFLIFCYFLFSMKGSFVDSYVATQEYIFLKLNKVLSVYPNLQYNITNLGDALILFPFIFIFLHITPKLWEAILISSLFTLITCAFLKHVFAVPRPAAIFNKEEFTIIGRVLTGHTSLPSGHSMTSFMVITILMYAFMPNKRSIKILWSTSLVLIGFTIGFSRVAVGAHYPLDVVIGCVLGYILAILGMVISTKLNWLYWLKSKKLYPLILLILLIWTYLVILKLVKYNMVIFYLSLLALFIAFALIIYKYAKTAET